MTIRGDDFFVNMGPQHPSTHGVLRLALQTDGEVVIDAEPKIGYLHRCFEKCAENVTWEGVIPYTDRLDYVSAISNELPYCLAIETLAGITVPERGEYCRVIASELQRIISHLIAFATYSIDLGAFTPLLYAFREREMVLDIFERVCGARLLYNYIRIGGVFTDFDDRALVMTREFVSVMRKRISEYHQLLSYNSIFIARTAGVGVITREQAMTYNITGPSLRAIGVNWDLRKNDPYGIYNRFQFNVAIGTAEHGVLGDCWNRYMVRMIEIEESLNLIDQALAGIPARGAPGTTGSINDAPKVIRVKPGEVYCRAEGPRGEIGFYVVSDGDLKPFRVKGKSPSFCTLSGFQEYSRGLILADMVATLGSIDIVLGEIDR